LNRVDEIVVFHSLRKTQLKEILELQIDILRERLSEKDIKIELSSDVEEYLVNRGYAPHYGARPLKRLIQNEIETGLAKMVISGELSAGDKVKLKMKDGIIIFKKS
ncbi:hypothetical protein KAU43_09660, partial [candidate division WOR-3 bacterium]|nr:hypothetical protein [candidate division WOR-3 bacterium]